MSNTLLVVDLIGRNVLARLVNSLGLVHTANRDYEDQFMADKEYRIGSTVRIRLPVYFTVADGASLSLQNVIENQTNLTINYQKHIDVAFTSVEEQRFLQDPETNVYQGAAQALANQLDASIAQIGMLNFYRTVGTPGAGVTSFAVPNSAATMQQKYGVVNSAYMCFHPDAAGTLRASLQNSFNVPFNTDISQRATIGRIVDHDSFVDQNLAVFTTGSFPGTVLVNGAGQSGSLINLKGFTASQSNVLKPGDIISFAGVYGVNKANLQQVGYGSENLAQFCVQATANSDASGNATVSILPGIVTSGPYQNVTSSPADGAAVTCFGVSTPGTPETYIKNYCYSDEAFSMANVPGPISYGAAYSKLFTADDVNLNIRINIVYDPNTDQDIMRFDTFYGVQAFGDYGTVIAS